ncbi:dienelactone hydrolase family protein [Phenylobacterium sp.]|uniref:alpha/beta hydrolase n=1 Tax=Phenylobacterium sp. TaxID=1871053 RepID=UPI0030F41FBD
MSTLPTLNGPVQPPASGGPPKSLVILLHGYGSNGADLIGLVPHWQHAFPDTLFISPNAPQILPGMFDAYQWWPITNMDAQARINGAREAALALNAFIDEQLAKYGLSEDKLALVGFSQGTMMALQVGLRRTPQVAGILGYSGMLVDDTGLDIAKANPPILLVHGDADPMVPVAALHTAGVTLQGLGFQVGGHVSPGLGHSIDMDGLQMGGNFLHKVLG